jgi:hypothetical protein
MRALSRELEGYDHITVIESAIKSLQAEKGDNVKKLKRLPWIQFFLLKISLLSSSGSKIMTPNKFNRYANKLYAMQLHATGIDSGNVTLRLRPMMLQQLWYQTQKERTYLDFVRQSIFFSKKNPWYESSFRSATGLSLSVFYKISIYLLTVAKRHTHTVVDLNLFSTVFHLCPGISFENIVVYLRLVGVRSVDLARYFKKHKLTDVYQSEFFQDTPLKDRPVLINGSDLLIFDTDVFFSGMSQYVPAVLKRIPGYKEQFGKDYELYVDEVLRHSGIAYWRETREIDDFYKRHGIKGKRVDFLLEDDERVILIESKAIEPSPIVKTASDPGLLKKLLDDSFIKAIKQGVHSAYHLGMTKRFAGKRFFLLVVTHMDFGIYGGRWIADYVDGELESWIESAYPGGALALDDVMYCTVADLEDLARGHVAQAFDFIDVVCNASTKGLQSYEQKMVFSQALHNLPAKRALFNDSISTLLGKTVNDMDVLFRSNRSEWAGDVGALIYYRNRVLDYVNSRPFSF